MEDSEETLSYSINDVSETRATIELAWAKKMIPIKLDVGDVERRILGSARRLIIGEPINAANFVLSEKINSSYEEALGWINASLSVFESHGALFTKTRLLIELGRKDEAIATAERALGVGKVQGVARNSLAFLTKLIEDLKADKQLSLK